MQREIEEAGNQALAVTVDVRYEESVQAMMQQVVQASSRNFFSLSLTYHLPGVWPDRCHCLQQWSYMVG